MEGIFIDKKVNNRELISLILKQVGKKEKPSNSDLFFFSSY